jgi:hypothetical protein
LLLPAGVEVCAFDANAKPRNRVVASPIFLVVFIFFVLLFTNICAIDSAVDPVVA